MNDFGEDRLLAFGRELNRLFLALDPGLDEAAFLDLVDVHVLEADVCTVSRLQHPHDLANRRLLETQRSAHPDWPVEIRFREAMIFGGEVGRDVRASQAKRVELGREVAAHAIGADQHHCPDAVLRGAADRLRIAGGLGRPLSDRSLHLLDRRLRRIQAEI